MIGLTQKTNISHYLTNNSHLLIYTKMFKVSPLINTATLVMATYSADIAIGDQLIVFFCCFALLNYAWQAITYVSNRKNIYILKKIKHDAYRRLSQASNLFYDLSFFAIRLWEIIDPHRQFAKKYDRYIYISQNSQHKTLTQPLCDVSGLCGLN